MSILHNLSRLALTVGFIAGLTSSARAQEKDVVVDLGGGAKMEFVWVAAMNCWVGKYEVTNGEFRRFRASHNSGEYKGRSLNGDRQPVVEVLYEDVTAFVDWLNKSGKLPAGAQTRVPNGREWSTFARCGDGRDYPWGNEWPPKYGNYADEKEKQAFGSWGVISGYDDGEAVSCDVEKSGKNEWGLYGVGGNAWEFTTDIFDTMYISRVLYGGSWDCGSRDAIRCSNRLNLFAQDRSNEAGFRLMLSR